MSVAKQRIRKFHDASGYVRVSLHYGARGPGFEQAPYAQFVDTSGNRVDRHGRPIRQVERANFGAIEWDLPPPEVPPPAPDATVAAVWSLVGRSATFLRLMNTVRRGGFTLRAPRPDGVSGVLLGTPYIDVAARPRNGFVALLVEEVAVASSFIDGVGLPHFASGSPEITRVNATFLMERYGRGKLLAALVRDEILLGGGPDIGGPGLRGDQLEAFDRHRLGEIAFDVAAREIGCSPDGDTGRPFDPREGPPAARNLREAFADRIPVVATGMESPLRSPRVDQALAPLVALVQGLAAIEQPRREAAERALSTSFQVIDIANPYWTISRCGPRSPVVGLDLHEPNDGSAAGRFVLYPEKMPGLAQVAGSFTGGVPFHTGARASDTRATMAFPVGRRSLFAAFDIATGDIDTLVVGPPIRR